MPLLDKHYVHDKDKLLSENQIIKVRNLRVNFKVKDGLMQAVRNVDLTVYKGQIIGIVGESGCGKSVCVKSLIGFNDGAITEADNLNLANIDLLKIQKNNWAYVRGNYVSYIPQDPLMSLNPTKTIGKQVIEAIYVSEKNRYEQRKQNLASNFEKVKNDILEKKKNSLLRTEKKLAEFDRKIAEEAEKYNTKISEISKEYSHNTKPANAKAKVIEILEFIGIENAASRLNAYPHEFSGGMRQRIVIAISVATRPDVIIADEPTTALDVTIQAKVLSLIKQLRDVYGITVIFISHNIALVANFCDYVYVMYAGKIVEQGLTKELFTDPKHPYTWALLASIPEGSSENEKLEPIAGTPPNLVTPPKGDAFAARNKYAIALDFEKQPPLFKITNTHKAATWLLHPKAPKIEVPKEVQEKIKQVKKSFQIHAKQKEEERKNFNK